MSSSRTSDKSMASTTTQPCFPYIDEGDSDDEPIELEGGQRMVIRRCIISPDEATMPEEDPDRLEDLGA